MRGGSSRCWHEIDGRDEPAGYQTHESFIHLLKLLNVQATCVCCFDVSGLVASHSQSLTRISHIRFLRCILQLSTYLCSTDLRPRSSAQSNLYS